VAVADVDAAAAVAPVQPWFGVAGPEVGFAVCRCCTWQGVARCGCPAAAAPAAAAATAFGAADTAAAAGAAVGGYAGGLMVAVGLRVVEVAVVGKAAGQQGDAGCLRGLAYAEEHDVVVTPAAAAA